MEALTYELLFPSCHCSNKASSQVPLRPTLPFPNSISGDEEGGGGERREEMDIGEGKALLTRFL